SSLMASCPAGCIDRVHVSWCPSHSIDGIDEKGIGVLAHCLGTAIAQDRPRKAPQFGNGAMMMRPAGIAGADHDGGARLPGPEQDFMNLPGQQAKVRRPQGPSRLAQIAKFARVELCRNANEPSEDVR